MKVLVLSLPRPQGISSAYFSAAPASGSALEDSFPAPLPTTNRWERKSFFRQASICGTVPSGVWLIFWDGLHRPSPYPPHPMLFFQDSGSKASIWNTRLREIISGARSCTRDPKLTCLTRPPEPWLTVWLFPLKSFTYYERFCEPRGNPLP